MRPLLLLLLLLVPAVAASDATQSTGGGAHDGFRHAGDTVQGLHVEATLHDDGLGAVTLDGTPLLDGVSWRAGTWVVDGPLAVLDTGDGGSLSLHDNRFGWITVRAEGGTVALTGTTRWSLDGDTATSGPARVLLERPGTLDADGDTLTASFDGPAGLAVATEPGIFGHAPRAGAWAVVHVDPDQPARATADWLLVHDAPFRLTDAGPDRLAFDLVGTLGDGTPDLLVRFDLHGFGGDGGLVLRMADLVARPLPAEAVLDDERGPLSFNATTPGDGGRSVLLRLPAGLSGHLTLTHDDALPTVTVTTHDLDPWAPQERLATLVAVADEPGTATLRVGEGYEKRTVVRAYEHTFRLVGLEPDTSHSYEVRFLDLAGNEAVANGTFQTGPAAGGSRHIDAEAEPLASGAWRITANVTDHTGLPVEHGVSFFVDKQATLPRYEDGVWVVVLEGATPGEHEVAVEVLGPDGRVREVLWVTVEAAPETGAPAPPAAVLLASLAAVALARRTRPPQP